MAELVQQYLDRIRAEQIDVRDGALANYIPELANVDPEGFGLSLSSSDGYVYESGDAAVEFTIQSISKPFTYALALDLIGQDAVDARIGVEPSGEAFNEISVDDVTKTPKNPMINAGAIAAVSLIPGAGPDEQFDCIHEFYSACAGRRLEIDMDVYASEKSTGNRNRAIAYMLASFGVLDGDPDDVLDVYFRQCSVKVTSTDLARMAATLARGGLNPLTGRRVIDANVVRRTLSVMVTCGMYDATGDWVSAVGMPAKSGVGGGIVAVLPGQLGIGVYFHPLLGLIHIQHRRQLLVGDVNQLERLLGGGDGFGHHGGDGFAREAHAVHRHRRLVHNASAHQRIHSAAQVLLFGTPGDDRANARHLARGGDIYRFDERVGVRTAQHPRMQHAGELQVVNIKGLSGDFFTRVRAQNALAHNFHGMVSRCNFIRS